MSMKITSCSKIFFNGVKRDHYDKFIGIREFLEQIAMDCFSNYVTIDTGTLKKIIPFLDKIDNEVTVSTCRNLKHFSYSLRNSVISPILDIPIATDPTIAIGHADPKEVELEGGRYNREAMGNYHRRLPNGKICLKRILWYQNFCLIQFGRRTYYCKHNFCDCFTSHHGSLVHLPRHVCCLTRP